MHQLRDPLPRSPDRRGRLSDRGVQASPSRVRLIVCGEPSRGDDGLGPAAVAGALARLPAAVRERVEVRRRSGLDPLDLVDCPAGTALLVVDCVVGVSPGELVRLPLDAVGRRSGPTPASSHTLPLADVVGLARAVAGRPVRGVFLGLGGADFRVGAPLGREVVARLPDLEVAIAAEIERLLASGP